MTKIAIYPGTFDPITFGHVDIIKRAAKFSDHVIIAPAVDNYKSPLFLDGRVELVKEELKNIDFYAKSQLEKLKVY